MFQLMRGVSEIHSKRLIHRDIKSSNILIKGDVLKIADFGLARSLAEPNRPYTVEVSTLLYRAPEVILLEGRYSNEIDIWSCACVFFEIVTSSHLFAADSDIDLINRIFQYLGTPSKEDWPEIYQSKLLYKFNIFEKQTI